MSTPAEGGRLGRGLTGRLAVLEEPARFWEPCCDPCWDRPSMGEGSSGVMGAEGALCRLPPLCRPSGDSLWVPRQKDCNQSWWEPSPTSLNGTDLTLCSLALET